MVRLNTLIGRLFRRQGTVLDLPDADLPLPGRPTTTERLPPASSTSAASTPTSRSTTVPTSTSAPAEPPASSSTTASSTTAVSQTRAPTVPTTTSTTTSNPVIVVQTTAATPSTTNDVSTALTPTTSLVIQTQTVAGSAPPQITTPVPNKAGAASSNNFLENKVASGIVFGLCGLVGLLLIFLIVWFAMRKRRRIKQLEKEIISFDPEDVGRFHQRRPNDDTASIDSLEKGRRSGSSLGQYAGGGYASTMNVEHRDYQNNAPYLDYRPQRAPTIQRPGNAAFNSAAKSDTTYRTYAMPSQTYAQ